MCRGAPIVSKLFFIDDTIVFERVNDMELGRLKEILKVYERASGQVINLSKLEIIFSGRMSDERGMPIASVLGVRKVDQHCI